MPTFFRNKEFDRIVWVRYSFKEFKTYHLSNQILTANNYSDEIIVILEHCYDTVTFNLIIHSL